MRSYPARRSGAHLSLPGHRLAEALLEGALDTAVIGLDGNGAVTSWSAGAEAILGWAAADIIGRPLPSVPPSLQDANGQPETGCRATQRQGRVTEEHWQPRADGALIWAVCETIVLRSLPGQPQESVKILRDGTAARDLAERQRADAEFLRSVLGSSDDCIKVLDLDARVVFINSRGLRLLEIGSPDDIRGRVWPEVWAGSGRAQAWRAVEDARDGKVGRFEGPAETMAGTRRFWDVQVTPILNGAGQPHRLLVVSRDVTAVQEDRQRLLASEERLSLALGASEMVGIWDCDLRTSTVFGEANFARFHMLDLAAAEAGVPIADVFANLHPEDRPRFQAQLTELMAGGDTFDVEHRLAKPDGTWRWLAARGRVVRDPAGVPQRLPGALVDVTERRQAEEQQRLLMQELSHRAKNIFAVIHAIARQTLRGDGAVAVGREAFAGRLIALSAAHDVLLQGDGTEARLRDLVEATASVYMGEGDGRFQIAGPPVVLGARYALSFALVLHELGTNAVKYGALSVPQGRVDIRWWLDGRPAEQHLQFIWQETGGPPVTEPAAKGFGSKLIERSLGKRAWRGCQLAYLPGGVRLTVDAVLSAVQIP